MKKTSCLDRCLNALAPGLLLTGCLFGAPSCDDDPDYDRTGDLIWSLSADFSTSSQWTRQNWLIVPVEGIEQGYVYVKSRAEVDFRFEANDEESEQLDWFHVVEVRRDVAPDVDCLVFRADPYPGIVRKRTGCLSLVSQTDYLNDYIQVRQGYDVRVDGSFDWLKYGSVDPFSTAGEMPVAEWSAEQQEYGWTSIPAREGEPAYCYGRNGCLRLGDDAGHGADLLTPYTPALASDTALLVRFDAVAYADASGVQDNNTLTVRVLDGGMFPDGTVEKTLRVKHLDPASADPATDMWAGAEQMLYVVSWPQSPISGATRIELMAGDYQMESGNTRIFIDNFYVFRLQWMDDYEKLFGGLPSGLEQNQ